MKPKQYSKQWFFNYFKKKQDQGNLGRVSLSAHCPLWHIGVRENRDVYYFPNKIVAMKFNCLCKALNISNKIKSVSKPNWSGVYSLHDSGQLLRRLKEN